VNYYFELQILRIKRWFDYIGFPPIVGIVITCVLFIIVAQVLFYKTSYAPYLMKGMCASLLLKLGGSRRNELIRLLYGSINYRKIRIAENLIIAAPFALYLLYEQRWWMTGIMIVAPILMARVKFSPSTYWIVPTPFKRLLHEYTTGFRKYFWLILMIYYIFGQSIVVNNFTLSMVCLIALGLFGMSFMMLLEHRYFIWLHTKDVKTFLRYKCMVAITAVSILVAPAAFFLLICHLDQWLFILGGYLLALLYQVYGILTKYSAYPRELSTIDPIYHDSLLQAVRE
jgi:hypothetical protein